MDLEQARFLMQTWAYGHRLIRNQREKDLAIGLYKAGYVKPVQVASSTAVLTDAGRARVDEIIQYALIRLKPTARLTHPQTIRPKD